MNEKGVQALSGGVDDVKGKTVASLARTQDEGALTVRGGRGHSQGPHWTP